VAPANRFLHTVEEPKTWQALTLLSPLIPGGVLRSHRPSLDEEDDLRYLIRKLARARGMNPDDLDGTIYDSLYLRAFFELCVDEPEKLDYAALTPQGRRQHEALQALQLEVFAWLSLFRDDEADRGDAAGV
jgi:hypothetical protein